VAASASLWRFTAPVEVRIVGEAAGLPLEIEAIPPVVYARPGEMVRVVYRIRNADTLPVSAHGKIDIEPTTAGSQVQLFRTSCAGLNTFQQSATDDFEVVFRVQAAGLTGARQITLRQVLARVTP
jgi:cytochrome c oxidase assembly protein Cox11